jgi:hypothetical protein
MRIVRLFDRNSDHSGEISRMAARSISSSALPGREGQGPVTKRQRIDSVESGHSHNNKEDLLLASALYQKECNQAPGQQATQSSMGATDQGLNGNAP